METFFIYLIKSSFSLAILYLIYALFFRKETYFHFNRLLLLAIMLISIVLPALPYSIHPVFSSTVFPESEKFAVHGLAQFNLDEVLIRAAGNTLYPDIGISVWLIIFVIYAAGVLFKTIQFLFRLTQIGLLILKSDNITYEGVKIVLTEKTSPAYSFLNRIFINRQLFKNKEALEGIIPHEKTHIHQGHTFDLMFAELVTIFQWFNPFAWLLKKAIKENHEFIADRKVINQFDNTDDYRMLLFNQSNIIKTNTLTHNFSYSLLKRRLKMMKKSKNQSQFILGILFLIFSVSGLFFACSRPEDQQPDIKNQHTVVKINPGEPGGMDSLKAFRDRYNKWPDEIVVVSENGKQQSEKITTTGDQYSVDSKQDTIYTLVKTMPEFPGGMNGLMTYLKDNIRYPEQAKHESIQGKVFVSFVIEEDGSVTQVKVLRGIGGGCDEEAVRVVSNMPRWEPGRNENGEPVRVQYNLPVRYSLK